MDGIQLLRRTVCKIVNNIDDFDILTTFGHTSIVVTGFYNEARNDVKVLCRLVGIPFARDLQHSDTTKKETILIIPFSRNDVRTCPFWVDSLFSTSQKLKMALLWEVPVVTVDWLIDSVIYGAPLEVFEYGIKEAMIHRVGGYGNVLAEETQTDQILGRVPNPMPRGCITSAREFDLNTDIPHISVNKFTDGGIDVSRETRNAARGEAVYDDNIECSLLSKLTLQAMPTEERCCEEGLGKYTNTKGGRGKFCVAMKPQGRLNSQDPSECSEHYDDTTEEPSQQSISSTGNNHSPEVESTCIPYGKDTLLRISHASVLRSPPTSADDFRTTIPHLARGGHRTSCQLLRDTTPMQAPASEAGEESLADFPLTQIEDEYYQVLQDSTNLHNDMQSSNTTSSPGGGDTSTSYMGHANTSTPPIRLRERHQSTADPCKPVKLLLRAPRGNKVRERHGIGTLHKDFIQFAEEILCSHISDTTTISIKDKKIALRLKTSDGKNHLVKPTCFYRLKGEDWMMEFRPFVSVDDVRNIITTCHTTESIGEQLDLLDRSVDPMTELFMSTEKSSCLIGNVADIVTIHQIKKSAHPVLPTSHQVGSDCQANKPYYWRYEFDKKLKVIALPSLSLQSR